jgi:FtsP/CotA-like multicopper oxidase with cupredoxin domain
MTYFDFRIPGLQLTVIAADGLPVTPVTVDELRIAVAETYDVLVTVGDLPAYTLFAQSMDRTGYARGTWPAPPGCRHRCPRPSRAQC